MRKIWYYSTINRAFFNAMLCHGWNWQSRSWNGRVLTSFEDQEFVVFRNLGSIDEWMFFYGPEEKKVTIYGNEVDIYTQPHKQAFTCVAVSWVTNHMAQVYMSMIRGEDVPTAQGVNTATSVDPIISLPQIKNM